MILIISYLIDKKMLLIFGRNKILNLMKKELLVSGTILITSVLTTSFIIKWSSGIPGRTGSPGETTCSACHSGGSGTTVVNISATPAFTSNQYVPGTTYTVNVTVANNSYSNFGFGCEILDANSNTDAGIMTTPLTGVQFLTASNGRKNAVHTSPKSGTGSATFSFVWTAPTGTNNIVIYAAGNAVNANGTTSGDAVGTRSLSLSANTTGIKKITNNVKINVYPNPASDFISIHVENVSNVGNVNIELWDLKGNKVAHLNASQLNVGTQNIRVFLPDNVNSGLYILKIQSANNQTIASKMIIVKK